MEDGVKGSDLLDMSLGLPWSDVIALPAEPSSATNARHFVRNALRNADIDKSVIDSVELVVSELVTNAVLHAATGPIVTLSLNSHCIRLEVRDGSTAMPSVVHFGDEASTGRGLNVVGRAAHDWGFDSDQFGKTIWAEFPVDTVCEDLDSIPPRIHSEVIVDTRLSIDARPVVFKNVPIDLYMELEQSNDATLREFELLAIRIDSELESIQHIHHQLASLIVRSNAYFNPNKSRMRSTVQRARRRGLKVVDLKMYVDAESITFASEFSGLMTEADTLSERGILLTSSASEQVRQLRYWFVDEMKHQFVNGRPPMGFSLQSDF